MLLAMAKVLIDANTIDEPFLVEFTNAPQLVDAAGIILKDKDGKTPLVWDTVTGSAKPYVEGVKPALKGSYTVDGKPMRTAFQVLADSVKDITPQYAEEVAGIPAATVTRLGANVRQGSAHRRDDRDRRPEAALSAGGAVHVPRPVGEGVRRPGLAHRPHPQHAGRQHRRRRRADARRRLRAAAVLRRQRVRVPAEARRPRAERLLPVLEPPHRADALPHRAGPEGVGPCRTRRRCRSSTAPTARCRSRTRGSNSTAWRRPSTS